MVSPIGAAFVLDSSRIPLWVEGPVNAFLSLLLALSLGLTGIGLGDRLVDLVGMQSATSSERIVLAGGLGLGVLGYSFLGLGLIGFLQPWAVWAILVLAAVCAYRPLERLLAEARERCDGSPGVGFFQRLGLTLTGVIVLLVLLRGLAPVTDYDGLAYHLVAPRDYVEAGRILSRPGIAHYNFPLTVDLLYIPPILLRLESTAQLMHLGFGVLMGMSVYTLSDRLFQSRRGPWLALLVLGTTPIIGTVAGYAHTDLGWALFEFLASYAVLCWQQEGKQTWLVAAGIFAGFGLGSKYLGLAVWGALSLVVLIQSGITNLSRDDLLDPRAWKPIIADGLLFGLIALAVASPWYLKNWIELDNPFYPLWFGGKAWDAYQTANLKFMGTRYGPREGVLGLLLLPWDMFFHPVGHFGPIPFAFPPPPTLLLPLYLLVRRRSTVNWILFIALVRFGTWATSARNARYLLDIHPLLSIAVAYLLVELTRRRLLRLLLQGTLFVMLVANLGWQASLLMRRDPLPVILGLETRQEYLAEHNDPPYGTIQFINRLPSQSKTLFIGNGQSYYVTADHLSDISHGNWGRLVHSSGEELDQIHQALASRGFTHIYYSSYDFAWRLNFDAEGELARELGLFDRFVDHCACSVYEGEAGEVYELLAQCREK
jgi:hypothetical protein